VENFLLTGAKGVTQVKPQQIMIAIGVGPLVLGLIQAVIAYQTLQLLQEQSGAAA